MSQAYEKAGVPAKLLLHQDGHLTPTYPSGGIQFMNGEQTYDEILNQWFSHYLYGVDNGIENMPADTAQSNNDTKGWNTYDDWKTEDAITLTGESAKEKTASISSDYDAIGVNKDNWEEVFTGGSTASSAMYTMDVTADTVLKGSVAVNFQAATTNGAMVETPRGESRSAVDHDSAVDPAALGHDNYLGAAATGETADDSAYAYLADFSFSDAFDENGYLKGVTAADYVNLPDDYADITISADLGQVSEDDITNYINTNVLASFATDTQVTDRAAADGDTVNIDYVGRIDGVAFDGGDSQGNGYDLTLGSGTFIDGFEDQIVGHTPGETFDVTVTFPENYGNADLSGKEAVFETTLHYIKESVTPELTDDWVKENLSATMNLNSIDELKAFVKSTMLYDNQSSEVYSALHDKVSYTDELPQIALDYYRDVLLYRIYTYAQNYGTTMDALLASGMMGSSYDNVDAYLKDAHDSIRSITQQALLMQAVAEKMGFRCDTATMNADFGRYYGTTDPTQYVTAYGENYVKMNVLQSDVMQNLIDNVKYE